MGFLDSIAARWRGSSAPRHNVRRWRLPWGGGSSWISIGRDRYARAVVSSLFDLLFVGINNAVWTLKKGDTAAFARFRAFFVEDAERVVMALYHDGRVMIGTDARGYLCIVETEDAADMIITSADYKVYGESTHVILRPVRQYLDNVLNAAATSIRRLGLLVLISPKTDMHGNRLTDEELKAEEEALQNDYGVLDGQHVVKMFAHDYNINTVDVSGANLALDSRLQQALKMLCGKLKIPYELVPVAITGNPNQTGVYQQEAQKRLYQTVRAWLGVFAGIARRMGLVVDYDTPDAPQDYSTAAEDLNGKILANIKTAEDAGYIDHATAIKLYNNKITQYDGDAKQF